MKRTAAVLVTVLASGLAVAWALLAQAPQDVPPSATRVVSSGAEGPSLNARFIGNMAFAITDGAVTLMTDFPYQSGYSRYMTYASSEIRSSTPQTLALITHRHPDHWEPSLFMATDWKVAGPHDVTAGLAGDRVLPIAPRTTFGPVSIEAIETPHGPLGHYSYIVTWHGRRLYFSGDADSADSLAGSRKLDVAFVSPGLYEMLAERGIRVDTKHFVIYHHRRGERVDGCGANCILPRQGDTVRIE